MSGGDLILLTLAIPLACALAILALAKAPDVRETVTMLSALALAACCLALAARTGAGAAPALTLAEPLPGIGIAFRLEPMGALFAAMASCLWAVNSLYSIGYMRSVHAANQTRFYACFALALFAAVGAAMAANLFTLFIFYEILTLSTYPLVAHAGDARARRGARIYLITLIGASVGLLLPGVVAVQSLAGSTSFVPGGVLVAATEPAAAGVVLALVFLGCAKAALFPLHFWLPAAMVAPTPVSALLHAVAVVKMGVFVLLKVATYTFGPGLLAGLPAREFLLWVAAFTVVGAGVVALTRDDLKSRLAWSTVSQLGVIAMAALIATASSLLGGVLLMLSHALAKITLFFCAGAIYVATGLTRVSQLRGLGRRMPLTFTAFLVAAISVAGLPPLGGFWPKLMIARGGFEAGLPAAAWLVVLSSLLTLGYLIPVAALALSPPPGAPAAPPFNRPGGAPPMTLAPIAICALASLLLFFAIDPAADFLGPALHSVEPPT